MAGETEVSKELLTNEGGRVNLRRFEYMKTLISL